MKFKVFFIFLWLPTLTWAVIFPVSSHAKGDRLFAEGLYFEAMAYYRPHFFLSSPITLRLMHCYLICNSPPDSFILSPLKYSPTGRYLLSVALRREKNYEAASGLIQCSTDNQPIHVLLENGIQALFLGDWQKAESCFQKVKWDILNPQLYHFAQTYLAISAFNQSQFTKARKILTNPFLNKELLNSELIGLCYFYDGIYAKALLHLRQALDQSRLSKHNNRIRKRIRIALAFCKKQQAIETLTVQERLNWIESQIQLAESRSSSHFTKAAIVKKFNRYIQLECHPDCLFKVSDFFSKHTSGSTTWIKKICKLWVRLALAEPNYTTEGVSYTLKQMQRFPDEMEFVCYLAELLMLQRKDSEALALLHSLPVDSPHYPKGLYLMGKIFDSMDRIADKQEKFSELYLTYPNSPMAPFVFLDFYRPYDYFNGGKKPIKHLKEFFSRFPDSYLAIHVHYILGLSYKKNISASTGTIERQKDLSEAIHHFLKVEASYNHFNERQLIPLSEQASCLLKRQRATFETGLAYYSIGMSSRDAKKEIYLNYAEETFNRLIKENPKPILEHYFWAAQASAQKGSTEQSDLYLDEAILQANQGCHSPAYPLFKIYWLKGVLLKEASKTEEALEWFLKAEETGLAPIVCLSGEEKLELWMEISQCYRNLKDWNSAMMFLSKVINEETVSSRRLEAMYLRAEIYELQGRSDLAAKQLESAKKKGKRNDIKQQKSL